MDRGHGKTSTEDSAYEALVRAGQSLATDALWRDMLAENIYWASMEGFLQSSVLGAFNRLSSNFVADRERNVASSTALKPDLLVMDRRRPVHDEWWTARATKGTAAQQTYLRNARLIAQFKVAWTPGNADKSATLPHKIKAVKADVARLLQHAAATTGAIGVLMSGFHSRNMGAQIIQDSFARLRQEIGTQVESGTEVVFLDDYRPTRWDALLETDRSAFSTLWLARIR